MVKRNLHGTNSTHQLTLPRHEVTTHSLESKSEIMHRKGSQELYFSITVDHGYGVWKGKRAFGFPYLIVQHTGFFGGLVQVNIYENLYLSNPFGWLFCIGPFYSRLPVHAIINLNPPNISTVCLKKKKKFYIQFYPKRPSLYNLQAQLKKSHLPPKLLPPSLP